MACVKCGGQGFYLDRRCGKGSCYHPKANISPMACPERPCTCKAGRPHRDALRARIKRQEAMINQPPLTASQRLTMVRGEQYQQQETEEQAPLTV